MASTGNIPTVPSNYGTQEDTPFSPSGDFTGRQSQRSDQGQDLQQNDQSQLWKQGMQSQQSQDRDRSQQWQQPGQNQDWNQSGVQSAGDNDDGGFRSTNVQSTREGGGSIDGQEGLPQGKANLTDKFMGKIEKVAGKMTNNPEKHERGELREAGGKAAERGEARAAHD